MEAVVLAGGFGTRLRSVVSDVPKPMAPVNGEPFLSYILRRLAREQFTRIVLSVGYKAEIISAWFGDCFEGMDIGYQLESSPLGTGGAIRSALSQVQSDHAFVLNGDTFLDLNIRELEEIWQRTNEPLIVGRHIADASRYGRLTIIDEIVTAFVQDHANTPGVINAGAYVVPTNLFDNFSANDPFSFEADFLASEVRRRRFRSYLATGYFIDIGIPGDYARAPSDFAGMDWQ